MKTRIVIDSTADLSSVLRARMTVVPLTVRFGDEEFVDGVTISHREFYERLEISDESPITSQAPPYAFAEVFARAAEVGEEVVVLTISSRLSGTYQSACIAAADYPGRVHVVDTKTVTIGAGLLAEMALTLADCGMSAAAIASHLCRERDKVQLVAVFDTLKYLRRGGRISRTAAIAGSVLGIKPVIRLQDGAVEILDKARGRRQGQAAMSRRIKEMGIDTARPIMVGYTGTSDDMLTTYIKGNAALLGTSAPQVSPVGSVVGTHAGPNAIAVAFFKK